MFKKITFIILITALIVPLSVFAAMNSDNYQIYADVFDGGGGRASSTNYSIEGNLGESTVSAASSTNYAARGGFEGMVKDATSLTFNVSKASIALGNLSANSVSSDSVILTATTNNGAGYTAYIKDDGNLRSGSNDIDDVADGAVTAGSEEYGIAATGDDAQGSGDWAITASNQNVAYRTSAASSVETTVTFKAAISASTASGSYAHTVTFSAVQNY